MEHLFLLIDTAGKLCRVALSNGYHFKVEKESEAELNHASEILLLIKAILEENQSSTAQLTAISVCAGPGSYTGVRIGISVAKGMCYALDIPLILFNRLELMVNSFVGSIFIYKSHVTIFPILLARKGEYFIAGYDVIDNKEMKEVMPPQLMQEEQVSELLKVQPAHVSALTIDKALLPYLFELRGNHVLIIGEVDFKFWGCYVRERYDVKMFDDLYHSEPSYLKDVYFSTKS